MSLYNGESILLEDDQYARVLAGWDAGGEEFSINDRRIPKKAISYLGFTKEAAEEMRIDDQNYKMTLSAEELKLLKEKQYEEACRVGARKEAAMLEGAKERVWKSIGNLGSVSVELPERETKAIGMTAEESENGKAEYWVDENGQKMYS